MNRALLLKKMPAFCGVIFSAIKRVRFQSN